MSFDARVALFKAAVTVAPSPATSGTSMTVDDGSRLPATPFNLVISPDAVEPGYANAEIVRCTNVAGNVLTITRAQEGSAARTVVVGDVVRMGLTPKVLADIEDRTPPAPIAEEQGFLRADGVWADLENHGTVSFTFVIDGGGSPITTGLKGFLHVPFNCTIYGWTLLADQAGDVVIDVWKDVLANFPPTVADTITDSNKPTLSAAQSASGDNVGWTTTVAVDDVLAFKVDSASTVTRAILQIKAVKTSQPI